MSAGKFVKGAPSPNPAGRPTKLDSTMRQVRPTLLALGASEQEISAIATAFAEESMLGIKIVMAIICMRFDAKAAQAKSKKVGPVEPIMWQEESDGDIF